MSKRRFELSRVSGAAVTDKQLLDDLRRVAGQLGQQTVPGPKYRELGMYDDSTVLRRFGSWNKALEAAGLKKSNEYMIADERLFENILSIWQRLGRQPRRIDLASEFSEFSQSPYNRRFGSWGGALRAFVDYANEGTEIADVPEQSSWTSAIRTPRDPSLRLRYKVLVRDGFKCSLCGASPAISAGVTLHLDHIKPWSKGGETTFENLRTTCERCNLGKGNEL
jgi:hypothetical protein